MVKNMSGDEAEHWCQKGRIVLWLEGRPETHLSKDERVTLGPGESYQVADGASSHKSVSTTGAKL